MLLQQSQRRVQPRWLHHRCYSKSKTGKTKNWALHLCFESGKLYQRYTLNHHFLIWLNVSADNMKRLDGMSILSGSARCSLLSSVFRNLSYMFLPIQQHYHLHCCCSELPLQHRDFRVSHIGKPRTTAKRVTRVTGNPSSHDFCSVQIINH